MLDLLVGIAWRNSESRIARACSGARIRPWQRVVYNKMTGEAFYNAAKVNKKVNIPDEEGVVPK